MKQLDLWLAIPDRVSLTRLQERFLQLLSSKERQQHQELIREPDRQLYLLSHSMLRIALSHRTARPVAEWVFEQEPAGKPHIADDTPGNPEFSLSHTAGLTVCALSQDGSVGVDVEPIVRGADVLEIASTKFTDPERRYLEGLPGRKREEAAVWMWTAKEATLKATGQGLGASLSTVIATGFPGMAPKIHTGGETQWAVKA